MLDRTPTNIEGSGSPAGGQGLREMKTKELLNVGTKETKETG